MTQIKSVSYPCDEQLTCPSCQVGAHPLRSHLVPGVKCFSHRGAVICSCDKCIFELSDSPQGA